MPPASPTLSAGRTFSVSGARPTASISTGEHELPAEIRDELLTPWTKEGCIAAVEKEIAGSISNYGSRRGNPPALNTSEGHSPAQARSVHDLRQMSVGSGQFLAAAFADERRNISPGGMETPLSSVSAQSVTRVTVLKQVLAGKTPPSHTNTRGGRFDEPSDSASDSMVPNSFSTSERSLSLPPGTTNGAPNRGINIVKNENRTPHHHQKTRYTDLPRIKHQPPSSGPADASAMTGTQEHNVDRHPAHDTQLRDASGRIDTAQLLSHIDVPIRAASGAMAAPPY